jgi:arsenite oxidase small subunit
MDDQAGKGEESDPERRHFLKVTIAASALLAAGGVAAVAKSLVNPSLNAQGPTTFPKVKVAALSSLSVGVPVTFYYPLDDEPNILVKLGQKAENGVGPDGDVVAYSNYCQHLGCLYGFIPKGGSPTCNKSYVAQGPVGYCCCHGSIYDFTSDAKVIGGPAPRPLPMVILEVDSAGDIYATGMTPPAIYGHDTGSSDVTNDLQGGNLVT